MAALPPGWAVLRHERYGVEAYFHAASRVCSWTRPYACHSDVETHEPPAAVVEDATALIDTLVDVQVKEATASAMTNEQVSREPEERLEAELRRSRSHCVPYDQFAFEPVQYDVQKPYELALALLRQYSAGVFGARAMFHVEIAQGGHWQHPPHVVRIELLGVTVATACHTNLPMCKGTAAENALLALCPHLYQEQLCTHNSGRRLIRPVITEPSTLLELTVDDPRIFDLDLCLGKSPAQMLQVVTAVAAVAAVTAVTAVAAGTADTAVTVVTSTLHPTSPPLSPLTPPPLAPPSALRPPPSTPHLLPGRTTRRSGWGIRS